MILTSTNDSGLPADGIITLCADGFHRDNYDPAPSGSDPRASCGIVFNADAVWNLTGNTDFVFGAGKDYTLPNTNQPTNTTRMRWMLAKMFSSTTTCPGGTFAPPPPDRVKRVYFDTPPGRYGEEGRGWYIGGSISLAYNQFLDSFEDPALPTTEIVVALRDDSPWGLVVLNAERLQEALSTVNDGDLVRPQSHPGLAYFLTNLDTHPEFKNLDPTVTSTPSPNFFNYHDLQLLTHFPHILQLPGPEGPSEPYWVIAAGSGTIYFPTETYPSDSASHPDDVYEEFFEHSMVRIFVAQEPTAILDQDETTTLPSYTLIGPSQYSHAFRIEPFDWDDRSYLVVSDIGGAVQLWDLTELLDSTTPDIIHPNLNPTVTDYDSFMLEEWRTPDCISDDLPNTVWGLDVDLADIAGDSNPDEVHIYVMVGRVGCRVLEFDETGPPYLVEIDHIETPSGSGAPRVRTDDDTGATDLLIVERDSGLRLLERP